MGATSRWKALHNVNQRTQKFFIQFLIHRVLHKCYINSCFLSSCSHAYNLLLLIVSLLFTHYSEIHTYIHGKFRDHVYKHKDDAKTLLNEKRDSLTSRIIKKTCKSSKELWTLTSITSGTPLFLLSDSLRGLPPVESRWLLDLVRWFLLFQKCFFKIINFCLRNKYFAPFWSVHNGCHQASTAVFRLL